jgi:hypothetical protein
VATRTTRPCVAGALLALASLGAAAAAAQAPPATRAHQVPEPIVVRPQVGMAGVALGDRAAAVRRRLGPPARTAVEESAGIVFERWFYRGLRVGLIGAPGRLTVLDLRTGAPDARTPRGVGVGSPRRAVREAYPSARCTTFRRAVTCAIGEPGFRQTGFIMRSRRVAGIFVADVF